MVVLSNPELVMQVQGRSTFRGVVCLGIGLVLGLSASC